MSQLPIPDFYRTANASSWSYQPDQQRLLEEAARWRSRHRLLPSSQDRSRVHLLLVDVQRDFCFPEGSLYVAGRSSTGAMDDSDRIARFIYRNLHHLTDVTCTLDTHYPHQIFFPSFWLDGEGRPPPPHREVSAEAIESGELRPNPALASWLSEGDYGWLQEQVLFYCRELEKAGKYKLYLWPPHCILGSDGHPLVGVVQEARMFHAYVRGAKSGMELKGGHPLTENYSVLAPEVLLRHDGGSLAGRNTQMIQTLLDSDAVVVAGQAASHCVKSTLDDLLSVIRRRDPSLARKVYVLKDCMSAVTVPDPDKEGAFLFDFTTEAEAALERFTAAGMHVVSSTEPVGSWLDAGR